MPFGGLVVNRVRTLALPAPPVDEAALASDLGGDGELAARSIQALRDLRALAERDAASVERLFTRLDDHHPILVPSWRGTSTVWRASSTSSASCSPSRESVRRCWLTVRSEYVDSGAIGASFVRPAGGDDHHPVLRIEQGLVLLVPTDAVVLVAAATDDLDDLSAPGRHSR
jgi:hypothetical protein